MEDRHLEASTNSTESSEAPWHTDAGPSATTFQMTVVSIVVTLLSIVTAGGNLMVMISFKMDRQLQTVSNYFLLSLSVADFAIGFVSMPLYTVYLLLNRWPLGPVVCDAWLSLDYTVSNASVANLLIISFDRYFSVTRPLTYRARRTPEKATIVIVCAWVVSALLWTPWIFAWPYIEGERSVPDDQCYIQFLWTNQYITVVTAVVAFYLPVLIMSYVYYKIYLETEKRQRSLVGLQATKQQQHQPSKGTMQRKKKKSDSDEDADYYEYINLQHESLTALGGGLHRRHQMPRWKECTRCCVDSSRPSDCSHSQCNVSGNGGLEWRTSRTLEESRGTESFSTSSSSHRHRIDESSSSRSGLQRSLSTENLDWKPVKRGLLIPLIQIDSNQKTANAECFPTDLSSQQELFSDSYVHVKRPATHCMKGQNCEHFTTSRDEGHLSGAHNNDPSIPRETFNLRSSQNVDYSSMEGGMYGVGGMPRRERIASTGGGVYCSLLVRLDSQSSSTNIEHAVTSEDLDVQSTTEEDEDLKVLVVPRSFQGNRTSNPPIPTVDVISTLEPRMRRRVSICGGGGGSAGCDDSLSTSEMTIEARVVPRFDRAIDKAGRAKKEQQRRQRQRQERRQDKKAAKTLSAILLAFIVTWTPYNVFTVVRTFCPTCLHPTIYAVGQ